MFEPIYYEIAIEWFAGWIAGIFWIGMEIGVPKPGTDPIPWGRQLLTGAIGGGAAVLFSRLANVRLEPMTTVVVAAVVGAFAVSVVAPLLSRRAV